MIHLTVSNGVMPKIRLRASDPRMRSNRIAKTREYEEKDAMCKTSIETTAVGEKTNFSLRSWRMK